MYLDREEIRTLAGQQLIFGFFGTGLNAELKEMLREIKPSGIILFSRNIESPEQVAELCREIKDFCKHPVLLSIDQEGGRVARLKEPATLWPPMRVLGEINDPDLTFEVGLALGSELRCLNIDLDFAPVLDVDTNPLNPIIGDRAFSADAKRVAVHGTSLFLGLQAAGVAGCGKHFPGHGDTDKDSHLDLPFVQHDLKRLRDIEWLPFKEAIARGLDAIMTAHVVVESIDPGTPATFSRPVLKYLRDELKFEGVILSDDLEMQAVFDRYSLSDMASLGLQSGIDIFLVCKTPQIILEFYRALVQNYERQIPKTTPALQTRITAWRNKHVKMAQPSDHWKTIVGCQKHIDLVQRIQANRLK